MRRVMLGFHLLLGIACSEGGGVGDETSSSGAESESGVGCIGSEPALYYDDLCRDAVGCMRDNCDVITTSLWSNGCLVDPPPAACSDLLAQRDGCYAGCGGDLLAVRSFESCWVDPGAEACVADTRACVQAAENPASLDARSCAATTCEAALGCYGGMPDVGLSDANCLNLCPGSDSKTYESDADFCICDDAEIPEECAENQADRIARYHGRCNAVRALQEDYFAMCDAAYAMPHDAEVASCVIAEGSGCVAC